MSDAIAINLIEAAYPVKSMFHTRSIKPLYENYYRVNIVDQDNGYTVKSYLVKVVDNKVEEIPDRDRPSSCNRLKNVGYQFSSRSNIFI
jgi:hypothetical protein